jgi:hypothetical protein
MSLYIFIVALIPQASNGVAGIDQAGWDAGKDSLEPLLLNGYCIEISL